jgi:hypothetical protein
MTRPVMSSVSPFLIVRDVPAALSFYRDKLGFEVAFQNSDPDPFFAIVCRDGAMIFVKSVGVEPLPNSKRHPGRDGILTSMYPTPMRWRPSLHREESPFPNLLKIRMTVCVASSSKTLTAISCFLGVLAEDA